MRLISSASAPISIARAPSEIKSPAPGPTIPNPIIFFVFFSNIIFVFPCPAPTACARPLAAQGKSPFSYSIFCSLTSLSVNPTHAISGSVYTTFGIALEAKAAGRPQITSAATLPSCVALCAVSYTHLTLPTNREV